MGSLFRSEDMTLCQLYLQSEAAYSVVSQLGELGVVQFKDLNKEVNAFQRRFVGEVRRCEEMERQLRFFEKELKKDDIKSQDSNANPDAPDPRDMIDLEATYERMESELREMNSSLDALKRNHQDLTELKHVLRQTDNFFIQAPSDMELDPVHGENDPALFRRHLGYYTGVMPREKLQGFMRLLWFACRGNVFVRHVDMAEPVEDSLTGDMVNKVIFMVFFQGDQLKAKVKKICEGFKATLYPVPESLDERTEMSRGIMSRMQDLDTVLVKSHEQRHRILSTIAQNLNTWMVKVLKIKAIYYTMNMFHGEGKNFIAECWLPTDEIGTIQTVLHNASEETGISAPSLLHPIQNNETLPTYHRTNKFTKSFQAIIDAYGVATYKEVNPAPFSIVTFPFLFSVMFGDCGHGLIMFLFGLGLVLNERKLTAAAKSNEMFGIIFAGRYIIVMMGLFSVYSGFIYNDVFSKSFNVFGSSWHSNYTLDEINRNADFDYDPKTSFTGNPYPVGVDPAWQLTSNKITFTNSFKEKLSVIIGVSQMTLGIMLGLLNHTYFKSTTNILCEFIPMITFLMSIFGYMCALIIAKWIKYDIYSSGCAPSILIGFINMFLFKYPDSPCSQLTWFPGQMYLQYGLVAAAGISAGVMLLAKPLVLKYRHSKMKGFQSLPVVHVHDSGVPNPPTENEHAILVDTEVHGEETSINVESVEVNNVKEEVMLNAQEEFDFGEIFIGQVIHTIEFCLGCVSHTASYLRLWALSLAHAQLSEVLWDMVLKLGFTLSINGIPYYFNSIVIAALFAPFAVLTVAILLLMEGLSAFLHTLRLHWVEFNSKFYKGAGEPFHPFRFTDYTEKDEY